MSINQVPRLQAAHILHLIDEAICFPPNKHRTYFMIQDTDAQNLHYWIGDNPPPLVTDWLSLGGSTVRDSVTWPNGLYGPIYVSEVGGVGGDIFLLSNLIEEPEVVLVSSL